MFLMNSVKKEVPTYIVSCDIKSAYDQVNQRMLFNYMKRNILQDVGGNYEDQTEATKYRKST